MFYLWVSYCADFFNEQITLEAQFTTNFRNYLTEKRCKQLKPQFCFDSLQNYKEKDAGKVVVYTTSMGIVRETYTKCANVKQILKTLLVKFEERDVFMSNDYQQEIKDRMQSDAINVPQLFVDGQHVGVSIEQKKT